MGSESRKKKRKSPRKPTGPKKGQLAYPLLGLMKDRKKLLTWETRHALSRLSNALAHDDGYESLRAMPVKRGWLSQRATALHIFCLRMEAHWLSSDGVSVVEHERYVSSCNTLIRLLTALGIDRPSRVIDAEVIRKQLKEGGDADDEMSAASTDVVQAMGDGSPLQMETDDGVADEKESKDTTTTDEGPHSPGEDQEGSTEGLQRSGQTIGLQDGPQDSDQ
jgi:hypothetical protein